MKTLVGTFVFVAAIALGACTTAARMNRLSLGMTKQEVVSVMGQPASTAASGTTEVLRYRLSSFTGRAWHRVTEEYFVRLVNGRVESYGKTGDFDSAKEPTLHLQIER